MAFHVGQKVVCISGNWCLNGRADSAVVARPRKGEVYIIRSIYVAGDNKLGLRFHWLINPPDKYADGFGEPAFNSSAFRPVIERKSETDIAIFREILDRETIRDPVRVGAKP